MDKWLGGRIKPTVIEDAAQLKVQPGLPTTIAGHGRLASAVACVQLHYRPLTPSFQSWPPLPDRHATLPARAEPALDPTHAPGAPAIVQAALARLGGGYVPPGRCSAAVLIMSYDVFRLNQEAVYCKKFELVICDEAHRLKVTRCTCMWPAVLSVPCSGTM